MTVCIKYPDISSQYYLALYKRTRRHRLHVQINLSLISHQVDLCRVGLQRIMKEDQTWCGNITRGGACRFLFDLLSGHA